MESRAKVLGHPAHPIMVVFPLGLLSASVIFDMVYVWRDDASFALVSYWTLVGGILGGLLAAIPGWIDWFAIPSGTRAKRVGLLHGIGNVVVLLLYIGSWLFRHDEVNFQPPILSLGLSVIAFLVSTITGWLGGELVDRLGVGVDTNAHLNAPSSLRRG